MISTFVRLFFGGVAGKVLGLVREALLAALFGVGQVVAANRVALSATFIPVQFFTADAFSAGFLPLYAKYRHENPAMALALYRAVRNLLAMLSLALTIALILLSNLWVSLLAPGLDAVTSGMAAEMLVVAAIAIPFLIQFTLHTLVALAHDDTRLINLRASMQSIGLILGTVAAFFTGNIALLAWGFTTPYVLLWCWSTYWVRRKSYLGDGFEIEHAGWRSHVRTALGMFWRRLRPLLLIPLVLQGSIAVERIVGSLLGVEVVAATEYSRFIVDSCMALLAAPLGLASLAAFARRTPEEVSEGLRKLVPSILMITLPISLILCINSTGIVRLIYGRGQFDEHAVAVASVMLLGFAIGIWAHVLGHTFVKVLNSRGANRRVAVVMILTFSTAIAVNLLFYKQLGAFTLGLASSVGGLVMLTTSSFALGVLGYTARVLAIVIPGIVLSASAGYLLSGDGTWRFLLSAAATGILWILYVLAIPSLRPTITNGLKGIRAMRSGSAAGRAQ